MSTAVLVAVGTLSAATGAQGVAAGPGATTVQLRLSFEGKAVAPSRIAALLKLDAALVDATLGHLVTRNEAKTVWINGRPGHVPIRSVPP